MRRNKFLFCLRLTSTQSRLPTEIILLFKDYIFYCHITFLYLYTAAKIRVMVLKWSCLCYLITPRFVKNRSSFTPLNAALHIHTYI